LCNEAQHIAALVDSVAGQTIRPRRWIIVDDGSSDQTWDILREKCERLDWVKLRRHGDKQHIGLSDGEPLTAMRDGLSLFGEINYRYLAKVDGDVLLEPSYFEKLLRHCEANPDLGIVSGSCWEVHRGRRVLLRAIGGSAWPPARLYRKTCFDAIDVGPATLGWDMLHVVRARARGWAVQAYLKPQFLHRRTMASRGGVIRGKIRYGRTSHMLGYSPSYFACRLAYQALKYPPVAGSFAMALGYLRSRLRGETTIVNRDEMRELRRMQKQALARPFRRSQSMVRGHLITPEASPT
jgi:glycosyltransferase involved in cell wall biosynthesis